MINLTFTLYLILCSPTLGCTELPAAQDLTSIQCLIAEGTAISEGRASNFECRREIPNV